ncbi:S8 family serine peptidase [Actinomadura rupiterrae]|uniref:S8 family serine peptidase n=1 Tax=Actinomadura rupiterrae TaxID=559627 RepID=UPI0020A5F3F2|nr:S8 family serine peptidase [Actinomadura rupiterrae]MCP2338647.1 subtilisin family serine protease [Actinomadura rupiterrae]
MRSPSRGLPAALLPVAVALGVGVASPALAAAPALASPTAKPAPAPRAAAGTEASVTLITGDVVTVGTASDGRTTATVAPAPGSSGGSEVQTVGKDTYVLPDAAKPLLAQGRLDRELFNVSKLVRFGYTNESGTGLPLIASYAGRAVRSVPVGAERKRDLPSINGAALQVGKGQVAGFWASLAPAAKGVAPRALSAGIGKVWLDGKVKASDEVSNPQIGAPEVWKKGQKGGGATVAVLDTGLDVTHPDMAGRVADGSTSFVPGQGIADKVGHGTHVSSTIAGTGAASDGRQSGVAPEAKVLMGKVLGDDGYGQDSWIISGMEWAASKARVVSMSLGDPSVTVAGDPMAQAVDNLTRRTGSLFVIAAGNTGAYGPSTVSSPGTADSALTVGAVDANDERAYFSSLGPRGGDHGMKPDIAAPGVDIIAARSKDSPGSGSYVKMSGTSMATPHVAGAAAILAQQHPDWKAPQIKAALMSTSTELKGTSAFDIGTGRLWLPGAVGDVSATGSQFFGFHAWPHTGTDPVTKPVTFTNSGDSAQTFKLSAHASGPDGKAADGLFKLSAGEITVPAHGSADVNVTADADDAPGTGNFTGQVEAAGPDGKVVAHTAVGLVKEDERYNLDVTLKGRDGKPLGGDLSLYRYGDQFVHQISADPATGAVPEQRLAPGVYSITGFVAVPGEHGPGSAGVAFLSNPHLNLTKNTALTLDAGKAVRLTVRTPKQSVPDYRRFGSFHDSGIGGQYASFSTSYTAANDMDDLYALPTGKVAGGTYDFAVRYRMTKPYLDVRGTAGIGRIDPLYFRGAVRLDGRVDLPVVSAGNGSADEYKGVAAKGAAVVITRSDKVAPTDAVNAAQAAGAAFLLVANDRPGRFTNYLPSTLPVASVTQAEGARLLAGAKRHARLVGSAEEFAPYKYDLSKSYPGGIPSRLSWSIRDDRLARIDERFVGEPKQVAFEARLDCRDYQWPPCLGPTDPQGLGRTRVSYVSTEPGNTWYADAQDPAGWEQRYERRSYSPGASTLSWFDPVTRPRLGQGYWGPARTGDWFQVNVPTDGGTLTTGADDRTQIASRLFQNGTLVAKSTSQAIQRDVPHVDGPAAYRFEQDTTNAARRFSTATRSAWEFTSTGTDAKAMLPLLQLGYSVGTDTGGNVRAGSNGTIGISTWQQPGAVGAGAKATAATLEVSFDDGATWQTVRLDRRGASWTGRVSFPRTPGAFVSVRASAKDHAGNTVKQEVIRAFGLK